MRHPRQVKAAPGFLAAAARAAPPAELNALRAGCIESANECT